ncbi:intestinal mucin-like protein [Aquarana catesbeiana]|uniref:intestinal mucin-like protein n=1 Tax=Aquarana catesbeiana TaxID=8400 RepID=UPI003CCA19D4
MPPSGGSCCPTYECACFPGSCSLPQVSCQPGFRPEVTMEGCCPKISCVPKGVCVKDGIEYPPGSPIYTAPNSCYECNCTSMVSSSTLLHEMNCQAIICNTACDPL